MWSRLTRLLRAGVAGLAATGADLVTLTVLVSVFGFSPRTASIPALVVGGILNFIGNREYAFRAQQESAAKQLGGYIAVELVALGLNGLLYDAVLRNFPVAGKFFWLVRLGTSNMVFLLWSYPLWRRVFRVRRRSSAERSLAPSETGSSHELRSIASSSVVRRDS